MHMMDLWRKEFGVLFHVRHLLLLGSNRLSSISDFITNMFYSVPSHSNCLCDLQNGAELIVVQRA